MREMMLRWLQKVLLDNWEDENAISISCKGRGLFLVEVLEHCSSWNFLPHTKPLCHQHCGDFKAGSQNIRQTWVLAWTVPVPNSVWRRVSLWPPNTTHLGRGIHWIWPSRKEGRGRDSLGQHLALSPEISFSFSSGGQRDWGRGRPGQRWDRGNDITKWSWPRDHGQRQAALEAQAIRGREETAAKERMKERSILCHQ